MDGSRLGDAVNAGLEPSAALELILQICRIVNAAHGQGVLHRDLKPDNILLQQTSTAIEAHVVDFGMAHVEEAPNDFRTSHGQEAGNRFLRLPEYMSGSTNKSDPRSDLTFCVGLLFFMLARLKPGMLVDEANLSPHQRGSVRTTLSQTGLDLDRLLAIFDIGFANDINKRYQTFDDFVSDILALSDFKRSDGTASSSAQRLRGRYMSPARITQREKAEHTRNLIVFVNSVLQGIADDCGGVLQVGATNLEHGLERASSHFSVTDPSDRFRSFQMSAEAYCVGNEYVLAISCGEAERFALRFAFGSAAPEAEVTRLRDFLLVRIDAATSDERFTTPRPLDSSPYHPYVGGVKPAGLWLDEEEAAYEYRPAIAITWFRPRLENERVTISWTFTNVGRGMAHVVDFSLPGLALGTVKAIDVKQSVPFNRHFDEHAAYHDIMKGTVLAFVEFADREGRLYRQSANVAAWPAFDGSEADYVTTQFGYPFLTDPAKRMINPPTDGTDPTYRTRSFRDLLADD